MQFRFDEPVAVRRNDRFIIRFYSPTITFGGGIVLEAEALKHKRNHEEVIDSLHIKELGTDLEVLELELKEESRYFPVPKILAAKLNWTIRRQRISWQPLRIPREIWKALGSWTVLCVVTLVTERRRWL